MEEILKYTIFSLVLFQNIVMIWFLIMLNYSLSKIKLSYTEIKRDDKKKLLESGLTKMDIFKSFLFYSSLKKYLWYDYALKENKNSL